MLLQPAHFYDISVLGLSWLSLERDGEKMKPRTLNQVFYTLRDVGLINEKQRKAAYKNSALRHKLNTKIALCQSTPTQDRLEALEEALRKSIKPFALLFREVYEPYEPTRILESTPRYRFHVTDAGFAYAAQKEGPYSNIITRAAFIAGWHQNREKAELIAASRNRRGYGGPQEDDMSDLPEDFMEFV